MSKMLRIMLENILMILVTFFGPKMLMENVTNDTKLKHSFFYERSHTKSVSY